MDLMIPYLTAGVQQVIILRCMTLLRPLDLILLNRRIIITLIINHPFMQSIHMGPHLSCLHMDIRSLTHRPLHRTIHLQAMEL